MFSPRLSLVIDQGQSAALISCRWYYIKDGAKAFIDRHVGICGKERNLVEAVQLFDAFTQVMVQSTQVFGVGR